MINALALVIVVRQTPDWDALARGAFHDTSVFDHMIGRPAGTTADLIASWNASFGIDFYRARARMKTITMTSLAAVRDAAVVPINRFHPPFDPRTFYVFTDDDDWFAPDLAATLASFDPLSADGLVWTSTRFDGEVSERATDGFCYTNNYAVSGRFLEARPETWTQAVQHFTAQALLAAPNVTRRLVQAPLSVTNKHPCSTVTLERAKAEGTSVRDLVKAHRSYCIDRPLLEPAWARPLMDEVSQFFASLTPVRTG